MAKVLNRHDGKGKRHVAKNELLGHGHMKINPTKRGGGKKRGSKKTLLCK